MGIFIYFVFMSLITYLIFWTDKRRARNRQYQRRISERTLMFLCFIGGAFGGLLAMYQLKHKTKKMKFVVGVPIALIVHTIFMSGAMYFSY